MEDTTLRDLFRGYYHPTPEEWDDVWANGLITLDANILVSMYNVHEDTSGLYLDAMEARQDQMWIPYQVAAEFHRNAHKERAKQTANHTERLAKIKHLLDHFRSTDKKTRLYTAPPSQEDAVAGLEKLRDELYEQKKEIERQTHHHAPDALMNRIAEVFATGVGEEPKPEDLATMLQDGEERFEKKTPPGYKDDSTKKDDRKYGDYILWRQLMNHAAEVKRDVIFVTDDDKADWWLKGENGTSLAPRPELIHEFREVTGQLILIINSQLFYKTLVPNANDGSSQSQRVTAAQEDMEAAVLYAREAMSRQDSIENALRLFTELYPFGSAGVHGFALSRFQEMADMGLPIDDQAVQAVVVSAFRDDRERHTEEMNFLLDRQAELQHELDTLPPDHPVAAEIKKRLDDIGSRLESGYDRQAHLNSFGLLF